MKKVGNDWVFETEGDVRNYAERILGFDDKEEDVRQGTDQITTFNQLGFPGAIDKPDGWYLPEKKDGPNVAIIFEAKSPKQDVYNQDWETELFKNIKIANTKYTEVVGILYNGTDIRVYKNYNEVEDAAKTLQHKSYYIKLFTDTAIDKNKIYEVTQRINNSLHFKFGMTDLQDRMIFTACALVAQRFNEKNGLSKLKCMAYSPFHNWIYHAIAKAIIKDKHQNAKLDVLLEEYAAVRMSITEDQQAIDNFIDDVCEIAHLVNSDNWNGEDVMAIFFNEFNRYRAKSQAGQVFTPDHITSFMYRLINVDKDSKVLDATCGSGAFLVKSMCNMIKEAGGMSTNKAAEIKSHQLFGIELYRKVYALACANMLIHKDGKTNLAQMDAKSDDASAWIKEKGITKVLMNPPYERKYGCMQIVENVLNSVPKGTQCAFILPDKKLEKDYTDKKFKNKVLKNNTLTTIIKLPENLFFGIGVTTSIFVFESGVPQFKDDAITKGRKIIAYYMEDDGLETVKNKGRQDIKGRWQAIEDYWIEAIQIGDDYKHCTKQVLDPACYLSYQMPEKEFELYEEDFIKTMMDYEMFKRGIDVKDFNEKLLQKVLYGSEVNRDDNGTAIFLRGDKNG